MWGRLLGSRVAVAILASVVTAAVVGGVSLAVAQTGAGGTDIFFACATSAGVVRSNTIHVNQAPATCPRATDKVTSWNAQGAPGAQGPAGQASVVAFPPSDCPTPPTNATGGAAGAGPRSFLAIPSIAGESIDIRHLNEIDLLSWSWGANSAGRASCGQAPDPNKSSALDLTVVKHTDKSSPKLMLATVQGTNLTTITLSVSSADDTGDVFSIALDNAIASSFHTGVGNRDPVPTDQVTFNGSRATVTERHQRADSTFDPPVVTCYDFSGQIAC